MEFTKIRQAPIRSANTSFGAQGRRAASTRICATSHALWRVGRRFGSPLIWKRSCYVRDARPLALQLGDSGPCDGIDDGIDQNRKRIPVENLKLFCDLLANWVMT